MVLYGGFYAINASRGQYPATNTYPTLGNGTCSKMLGWRRYVSFLEGILWQEFGKNRMHLEKDGILHSQEPQTCNHLLLRSANGCLIVSLGSLHPEKINMEPENHPFEKENHLPSTFIFGFHINPQVCTISRILYCKRDSQLGIFSNCSTPQQLTIR